MTLTPDNFEPQASAVNSSTIKTAKNAGWVMIVMGLLCIAVPNFIALSFNAFIGGVLLVSALVLAIHTWTNKRTKIQAWLKPLILAALALLILLHPAIILSILGILIAIFFILTGITTISLSLQLKSMAKWLTLFSGIISLVLGAIIFAGWPFNNTWIIGMIIGVNFISDGIALLSISKEMHKAV